MNDLQFAILASFAGRPGIVPPPDNREKIVALAGLIDKGLIRGAVFRDEIGRAVGATPLEATFDGLAALDAEERAREERKALSRLATRGDRLLMAVLAALVVIFLQRWLLPDRGSCACCRCNGEKKAEEEPRADPTASGAGAPVVDVDGKKLIPTLGRDEPVVFRPVEESGAPHHAVHEPLSAGKAAPEFDK